MVHFTGKLEGPRGDAIFGCVGGLAEDFVPFGICHDHFDLFCSGGDLVKSTKCQCADQDLLARLVDRLVGGEQYLVAALDVHGLLQ